MITTITESELGCYIAEIEMNGTLVWYGEFCDIEDAEAAASAAAKSLQSEQRKANAEYEAEQHYYEARWEGML